MYNSIVPSAHDFKLMVLEEKIESTYPGLLQVIKNRVFLYNKEDFFMRGRIVVTSFNETTRRDIINYLNTLGYGIEIYDDEIKFTLSDTEIVDFRKGMQAISPM